MSAKGAAIGLTAVSAVIVFIASVVAWYGVSRTTHVDIGLLCSTAGYSDWDCESLNQTSVPVCCVGAWSNETAFSVPASWWKALASCSDETDSMLAMLPPQFEDSKPLLWQDKMIECEAGKATSSWLKYVGGVFAWVCVFLSFGSLASPSKQLFKFSKFLTSATLVINVISLHQHLQDAFALDMFSFVRCQVCH
mmetsp:Transcript_15847/g.37485  ORF Transcript_15847/g.37485 Transcript_15847/m.37485 type:complete len:194 (+) Transcript_15847:64-645(+)